MVQLIFDQLSEIYFYWAVMIVCLVPISWLIISYIIPKKLLERYFKAPHFGSSELVLMAQFPGSLLRGTIFVASCIMPSKGQRRQMIDVPAHAPKWYRVIAYIMFYVIFLGFGGLWILLFFILLAMLPFVG